MLFLFFNYYVSPHVRLVRQGPAKRKAKTGEGDEDSDHWGPGGMVYTSEFEECDEDLAQFLKANAAFMVTMTTTGAFTDFWSQKQFLS